MSYAAMTPFSFIYLCFSAGLTVLSCLRILDKHEDCRQTGLDHCRIGNCTDNDRVEHNNAPTEPLWDVDDGHGTFSVDKSKLVPVVKVAWKIRGDGSYLALRGSQMNIVDENGNQSLCVQLSYKLEGFKKIHYTNKRWSFYLDVIVEPRHNYTVTVSNLPEPKNRRQIKDSINIPGCENKTLQESQVCQENGSLWTPNIYASSRKPKTCIVVTFATARYSEDYTVSINNSDIYLSKNISKENRTLLNVTFELDSSQLSNCEVLVTIQPFFIGCKYDCKKAEIKHDYCQNIPRRPYIIQTCVGLLIVAAALLALLLWRTSHKDHLNTSSSSSAEDQPDIFQVKVRKRVLIIYSLDHPLYKNIVLKLSAFLATKCGTEVVLDLLDSTRLGVLGSVQWLEWHKIQIESSSDKILILCSRGVQAKWRAMCGEQKVCLREDACSPVGDMLTPSLALLLPHFIHSATFKKYIVAYFDSISSEEDVPSPFKIAVRYQLMRQFEEVFFRILDTEKHEPGRVKQIDGVSEDSYHQCPSGRALRKAIEAFREHQLENPQWFEDELLESSDLEDEMANDEGLTMIKSLSTYCLFSSNRPFRHVETQGDSFAVSKTSLQLAKTHEMCPTMMVNADIQGCGVSCFNEVVSGCHGFYEEDGMK